MPMFRDLPEWLAKDLDAAQAEGRILADSHARPAPPVEPEADEKAFQAEVIKEARRLGWRHYHTYDSRKSAAGFPDLVLVRDRVVWVELKSATGRLTAAQEEWRDWLLAAGQEWHLWRPADWPAIVEVLK